jgi:hypothetical protein
MNAARNSRKAGALPAGGLLKLLTGAGGSAGSLVPIGLLMLAAVAAAWFAWRHWGPQIVAKQEYVVTPEQISITPQPPWIHSDVKADVVRAGSLTDLQLLDPDLALQVQQAFALHAWVAEVRRVRKRYPAEVMVELRYRRPVAMIKAASGGYWPVDAEGVLLPPDEFSSQQTRHYIRVLVENSQPDGPVGTPYGDQGVVGAARIADLLHAHREQLNVDHMFVNAMRDDSGTPIEPVYELMTPTGTRILWGRAPGREGSGEVTGSEKVARLLALAQQQGPLASVGGAAEIDLRDAAGVRVVPRTAAGPGQPRR